MIDIVLYPSLSLRRPSEQVTDFSPEIKKLVLDLGKARRDHRGEGLAAPQIGVNYRVIVVGKDSMVNPVIVKSWGRLRREEGCLSLPGIYGTVTRPQGIICEWQGVDGSTHRSHFLDLMARVACHEIDHLDGILFIDRLSQKARKKAKKGIESKPWYKPKGAK